MNSNPPITIRGTASTSVNNRLGPLNDINEYGSDEDVVTENSSSDVVLLSNDELLGDDLLGLLEFDGLPSTEGIEPETNVVQAISNQVREQILTDVEALEEATVRR
ncbi:hypothetical protein ABG067_008726, partial [Albugo candida]